MLPIVIVGFISVRLSAFNHFLEFIQGGDIMLTSALILASTLARTINKRIKKGFKYLMIIAMIIELIEYSLNYTNPFKSLAAIVVESGVALMSSVAFSIISAMQEEEK